MSDFCSAFPCPVYMFSFAHGLGGLMQTFLTDQFFRAIGKVPARQGGRDIDSQAQGALIFSFPRDRFLQRLFQAFQTYH